MKLFIVAILLYSSFLLGVYTNTYATRMALDLERSNCKAEKEYIKSQCHQLLEGCNQ